MKKRKFPNDVIKVRERFLKTQETTKEAELFAILANEDSLYRDELIAMWEAIKKRKLGDVLGFPEEWVHSYLASIEAASILPPYFYLNTRERKSLIDSIKESSRSLINTYKQYELDGQLFYHRSVLFGNWGVYEDYGDSNRAWIDQNDIEKLPISRIIEHQANRAIRQINEARPAGKSGKNVRAVIFVRELARSNMMRFNTPLYKVIATATNAIYDMEYSESDIRNLLIKRTPV